MGDVNRPSGLTRGSLVVFADSGTVPALPNESGWVRAKWVSMDDTEFLLAWNPETKRGLLAEKDEEFRIGVADLLACLLISG